MDLRRILSALSGGATLQAKPVLPESPPGAIVPPYLFSLEPPTRFQRLANSVVSGVGSWIARPTNEMQLRLWRSHLERNKANINNLADQFLTQWGANGQSTRPKALVLGIGDAHDIDLAHLGRSFDLILVDIKEGVGEKALKKIPYGHRGASKGVHYDLTNGIIANLLKNGIEAIKAGKPTEAIVDEAIERSRTGVDINPFGKVDFVVSSMLMSQLGQMPIGFLMAVALELGRFPEKYPDLNWFDAFSKKAMLQGALIKRHIDLLKGMAKEGAWVYAASDINYRLLTDQGEMITQAIIFDERGFPSKKLTDLIQADEDIQVQPLDTWEWEIDHGNKPEVQALLMAPLGAPTVMRLPTASF